MNRIAVEAAASDSETALNSEDTSRNFFSFSNNIPVMSCSRAKIKIARDAAAETVYNH